MQKPDYERATLIICIILCSRRQKWHYKYVYDCLFYDAFAFRYRAREVLDTNLVTLKGM